MVAAIITVVDPDEESDNANTRQYDCYQARKDKSVIYIDSSEMVAAQSPGVGVSLGIVPSRATAADM
jgi:hypothetical protein